MNRLSAGAFFSTQRSRLILIVIAMLGLASLVTWILQTRELDYSRRHAEEQQVAAIRTGLDQIENAFSELQESISAEGIDLAGDRVVIRNLRKIHAGDETGKEGLAHLLAPHALSAFETIEVYDPKPRLVGWSGASMPMDKGPERVGFLDHPTTEIVRDGDIYSALVVWVPVRDGVVTVGAIRMLRMIVKHVPIRNEFLRDYTLDEDWSRLTGLPVRIDLLAEESVVSDAVSTRILFGLTGNPLIRVTVEPPTSEDVSRRIQRRYSDLLSLWMVLALGIILVWLWKWVILNLTDTFDRSTGIRFLLFTVTAFLSRYLLIWTDVPGRWQEGKAPLAPLFDAQHFSSGYGYGLIATTGDLLVTAIFAVFIVFLLVRVTEPIRNSFLARGLHDESTGREALDPWLAVVFLFHSVVSVLTLSFLAHIARSTVLDSTLDYFERSNLFPQQLVLLIFIGLLMIAFAAIFISARMFWVTLHFLYRPLYRPRITPSRIGMGVMSIGVGVVGVFLLTDLQTIISPTAILLFISSVYLVVFVSPMKSDRLADWLHLRTVVPSVVLFSILLYPILEKGLNTQRHLRMQLASSSFDDDMDSRVMFALGQLLSKADDPVFSTLIERGLSSGAVRLDSVVEAVTRGQLVASLGTHDLTLSILDAAGEPSARYSESPIRSSKSALDNLDRDDFDLLHDMYVDQGDTGVLIEKMTGRRERERFVYEGFTPIVIRGRRIGWLLARAEPSLTSRPGMEPFPRVLAPTGNYVDSFADFSLAEFRRGVLVRSYGRSFGRYTLDASVSDDLRDKGDLWRSESIRGRKYLTFYRYSDAFSPTTLEAARPIIAARVPAINFFDHLFYLLRITVAGLLLGLPIYLLGLVWRFYRGLLPARRVHFRDKVLNAFFVVGAVTVAAMGWAGLSVVTGENDRAVESWLRQHLERVEDALGAEANRDELPYNVLERTNLDSLSVRLGLDLNVYRGVDLSRTTQPRLVNERLLDSRLPARAYEALFFDGFRFVTVDQMLGSFTYTAGYRALVDEEGKPRYVVALPTLPERERIEEERARTVAYLFGALLLLVLAVMVTAAALANALTRPIERLRSGLQAVAEGRFESIGKVRSRDEIGDLVDTFNAMQEQIVESRGLLARQERQLAWREMARQVAHEIKNPLTPMKLSIQHLRSAFGRTGRTGRSEDKKKAEEFADKFGRTTTVLIEQIDALARIADEFSSFGRMPRHRFEPLELTAVIEEAASLMANEADIHINMKLSDTIPIVTGDRQALRRVFINLIKNAAQAIPPDREGLVELSTEWESNRGRAGIVVTRIRDNGEGIEPELWDKIFVPSFSTKTSGTGLGLALAQKTIEDMDGEIGFDTSEEGTTFWIRLPAATD